MNPYIIGAVFLAAAIGLAFFLASKFKPAQKPADKRIDPTAPAIPLPGPGEEVNQYMLRCIRDPLMMKQFPDRNARINQCSALWRQTKAR